MIREEEDDVTQEMRALIVLKNKEETEVLIIMPGVELELSQQSILILQQMEIIILML